MTTAISAGPQRLEPAHDILHQTRKHPLDPICAPKVVAVIGATEKPGSVGRTVFENLGRGGFDGVVYPVNPKRASVLCVKAYPSIGAVPEKVDLAVISTPATTVPGIDPGLRQGRGAGRHHHFRRLQGNRRPKAWNWNNRFWPRRAPAACASSARIASASWCRTSG